MFAAALPDLDSLDLEAAKALLIAQHKRYTATLTSRASEIERLVLLVEKLQRMLFGAKSEKVLRQIEQPAVGDLCSRRRRPGSLDPWRMGGRNQRTAGSVG
jgi:hypothetical protein